MANQPEQIDLDKLDSPKLRRDFIRQIALNSWNVYEQFSDGFSDSVRPISKTPFTGWFGATSGFCLCTSLSTLWVMDLKEQFTQARRFVKQELDFGAIDAPVSVTMTVNGYLAGLLSTYALTKDRLFLDKGVRIAELLQPAYCGTTGEFI